jgi:hypothetical protein
MPNIQSPYFLGTSTFGAGSVGSIQCEGLALGGIVVLSGTVGAITLETTSSPSGATFGTLRVLNAPGGVTGAGTAVIVTPSALGEAVLFPSGIGPVYNLRATVVGSAQTSGTFGVYLRGLT